MKGSRNVYLAGTTACGVTYAAGAGEEHSFNAPRTIDLPSTVYELRAFPTK